MKTFPSDCLLWWVAASLFTWLLFYKTDAAQIEAAASIGAAATLFLTYLARYAKLSFRIPWSWAGLILSRAPWQLIRGIGFLTAGLWRSMTSGDRPMGSFHEEKFNAGSRHEQPGRRAVVIGAVSLTPTSFAVSVGNGNRILFHQLHVSGKSPLEGWRL
jgi:hypothetical protein